MKAIKLILYRIISYKWLLSIKRKHKKELRNSCHSLNIRLKRQKNEKNFLSKWKRIYPQTDVAYYRYYSHFIGENEDILSDDIFHYIIEPILNNPSHYYVYSDKNMYGKILSKDIQPRCIFRNINGNYMDEEYHILKVNDKIVTELISDNEEKKSLKRFIIKPTIESMGGIGVRLFKYDKLSKTWLSNDGLTFSWELLENKYKKDFIIQECVDTSDFVKQFNPESFSTFRVITYRSVTNDEIHILGTYMRVGPKGSFKDNIHCGGYAIPIDEEGNMFHYGIDENRKRYNIINGIDLSQGNYTIPNFEEIKKIVSMVANKLTNHRLISFDVILDKNNKPQIIEFNLRFQTITTIQTTMNPFLGKFTDEVLEYCEKQIDNIMYLEIFKNE